MTRNDISTEFYALVAPSHPNEWEVEEIVELLARLSEAECRGILKHIPAIWPISHSLCFRYVNYGSHQVHIITVSLLDEWVRQLLFHYETGGLRGAELFMADAEKNFLAKLSGDSAALLPDVLGSMTHYIRGVSGAYLRVGEDSNVWTDTETIYLPSRVELFDIQEDNKLYYKYLITYQWTLTHLGVFKRFVGDEGESELKGLLEVSERALVLFKIYLLLIGSQYIRENLPGLWHRCCALINKLFMQNKGALPDPLLQLVCTMFSGLEPDEKGAAELAVCLPFDAARAADFINRWIADEQGTFTPGVALLLGELRFNRAEQVIERNREEDKQVFVKMAARILPGRKKSEELNGDTPHDVSSEGADGSAAVIAEAIEKLVHDRNKKLLQIDNENVVVPDELIAMAEKIMSDIGHVPVGYVQAASGLAGAGILRGESGLAAEGNGDVPGRSAFIYDEWDCRRHGYRKEWCTVVEEELAYSRSNFIERTLLKYGGLRKRLMTQFELMRSGDRRIRRQRDGDELDLDAITDALGDVKAGKAASDRLFFRLKRDERSITTIFLIDMSNSTSGWIGTFIKESLVLLCEAMEKVGDEYGIYGFSGMRRSGCKLYPIKRLDEPYDADTRDRISSIGPKEYTRMAPAVRHLTSMLEKSSSKTRLLITLSDGKPEDYDNYSGEYAIEDTKKSLQEARGKGISPFCITIDKRAHDYLDHMFGVGNYIFINKIESLPLKMANIYRLLTR